jgi:ATP-binding cassette, subfamily B, multidrug efflux pump
MTVWSYLGRYRRQIAIGVGALLATNVLFLGVPYYMGSAVQALRDGTLSEIPRMAIFMMLFALATAITRIISRITIFNAARAGEYDLRSDLFRHMLTLDAAYYRKNSTGDVMSRLTNDVQTVRAMWGAGILNLINTGFAFVTVLFMMVRIDPILTLWAIIPYPTIYIVGQAFGKRIYKASQGVQAELGALSGKIQEDLGGIQLIKTYGLEEVRRKTFIESSLRLLDRNMALTRVRGQLVPMLGALSASGAIIILWVGGHAVLDKRIELGQLVELSGYVARLVWPTLALGWMLSLLQRGRASWSRLTALFATKPQIDDGTGPDLPVTAQPMAVEIKDLTVAVDGRTLLSHIDLSLAPGTVTAIVGRTGAGKSTLVDALTRLIDVPAGTIFCDGRDFTTVPMSSLRQQIGYAPQEAFLFSTLIADNIAMGYGGGRAVPKARAAELDQVTGGKSAAAARAEAADVAHEPRVLAAAKAAGLDRDLAAMPEGLETVVGERGITLSGGQRQRVALARAIVGSPRLLILDDSLSSVDAETEQVILKNLRAVMSGRTVVLISHRVAAVKDADQIAVIDAGTIVERGTHQSLLAAGGLYAELYRTQHQPMAAAIAEAEAEARAAAADAAAAAAELAAQEPRPDSSSAAGGSS